MDDDGGGFENYHVSVFGEPGTGQPFEWVLTGRHATLRADGNRADGVAFGGPIFHGHSREGPEHAGSVRRSLGRQAGKLFATLDDKQRAQELAVGELDGSQKQMVRQLIRDLTLPFRGFDIPEIRECLCEEGGADKLRLTYFHGARDIWKLEGPGFVWYFHGSPHVHVWFNIAGRA